MHSVRWFAVKRAAQCNQPWRQTSTSFGFKNSKILKCAFTFYMVFCSLCTTIFIRSFARDGCCFMPMKNFIPTVNCARKNSPTKAAKRTPKIFSTLVRINFVRRTNLSINHKMAFHLRSLVGTSANKRKKNDRKMSARENIIFVLIKLLIKNRSEGWKENQKKKVHDTKKKKHKKKVTFVHCSRFFSFVCEYFQCICKWNRLVCILMISIW